MAAKPKKPTFREECQKVAEEQTGGEVLFVDDHGSGRVYEDDGTLHVVRRGVRACFNVESDDPKVQNLKTELVLRGLGITDYKPESVFVEEDELDEDDVCPHCGQPI